MRSSLVIINLILSNMTKVTIYTDGACSGNPGKGGLGFVILVDGIVQKKGAKGFRRTTNNRMEILAVTEALRALKDIEALKGTRETDIKVTVCSDSQLVVNTMTKDWARKTNNDLWRELDSVLTDNVSFVKVKGHASEKWNEEADRLAVGASHNPTHTDTVYESISPGLPQDDLFPSREPEIVNIRLLNANTTDSRKVEVDLSNGTVVSISGLYGGFEQYNCTKTEAAVTVDIARKFTRWLNGGDL